MADEYILNEHNKEEFPPAHTAEHLLNQVMIRLFGCERSYNAHIERKKSKMSFYLDHKPTRQEEKEIEREMLRLIDEDLPVTFEFVRRDEIPAGVKLDRHRRLRRLSLHRQARALHRADRTLRDVGYQLGRARTVVQSKIQNNSPVTDEAIFFVVLLLPTGP